LYCIIVIIQALTRAAERHYKPPEGRLAWHLSPFLPFLLDKSFSGVQGAEVRPLFDENRVPPFQSISETRIRNRKANSENVFEIFG
jgi:hypothetical protein